MRRLFCTIARIFSEDRSNEAFGSRAHLPALFFCKDIFFTKIQAHFSLLGSGPVHAGAAFFHFGANPAGHLQ